MKRIVLLLLIVVTMVGCSNVYSADEGYRMSLINYSFPIPKNSSEIKPEACVGEISKSSKYKLKGIGGDENGPPEHYLNEIMEWGWEPVEEKSSDMIRFYSKENKTICVLFNKNVFDVYEITAEK
ncbi:hypothetical protein [Sporosarcina sp. FA9]|uniref:hypothetical protein n=1 Tax=Sporosarcina sp. FA9 TaxID=3413030 RepID=UPI003F65A34B